jgi:hypothetical protein
MTDRRTLERLRSLAALASGAAHTLLAWPIRPSHSNRR